MAYAVVASLLNQLSTLLREESALLGGLQDEIQLIKDEFDQMKSFLRRAEIMVESNRELETWVNQVRDVSHDVEDVLDEFMLRGRRHGDGFLGRVRMLYGSLKNLKFRHQIATRIHAIKTRIEYISKAKERYPTTHRAFDEQNMGIGRCDALFLEDEDLVGIERPKDELMRMLLSGDSQLRLISIVGMGGVGKTTLAKKVYDCADTKNGFKHHVWITVSQTLEIETMLKQIIRQLFKGSNRRALQESDLDTMDIIEMKQFVHDHLRQKKYIIVFDDVWSILDWDALRVILPKNNLGSRIIITTRREQVGRTFMGIRGDIYLLNHLNHEESWTLFCKKAFGDTTCPDYLEDIARCIVSRSEGLPLAIVVIGGILARKDLGSEEWYLFNRTLRDELENDNQLDNMTKILSLSYYDLPDHLRVCFLYLSILPEDFSIKKNRLIWLWIAEGFVQKNERMTMEEVAEGYLNELVDRNLVQIAEKTDDGRLKACRVHDIILDIILRKAEQQQIITIFSEPHMEFSEKVRRLVIHSSIDNIQVSNRLLKSLRSLILFRSIDSKFMPLVSKLLSNGLRLSRVLDLGLSPIEAIPSEIFKLFHLKYLNLRHTNVKTVPKSIGKLQNLETLDLEYTNVQELPNEILKLQKLRHLLVGRSGSGFRAPNAIGNLQTLQTLYYIDAYSMDNIKEIGKLTQLRRLGITKLRREDGKELCSSLERLTNLRSLHVVSKDVYEVIDLDYIISSTPQFLRTLELRGRLEKVPQWIISLRGLTKVLLFQSRLRDHRLQLLQNLPTLVELTLWEAHEGDKLYFKTGVFPRLKKLCIRKLPGLRVVTIKEGAMLCLEKLSMYDCQSVKELPKGMEHLISLQLLEFEDMSDTFMKMLEDMDIQSVDYNKIAHIPQVKISHCVNGDYKTWYFTIEKEMNDDDRQRMDSINRQRMANRDRHLMNRRFTYSECSI